MNILIDAKVLGTNNHLNIQEDGCSWVSSSPAPAWWLTGEYKQDSTTCLDTLLRLSGTCDLPRPPEKYAKMMELLAPGRNDIPWSAVMPQAVYKTYFNDVIAAARHPVDPAIVNYYSSTWVHGNELLNRLRPAKVDGQMIEKLCSESVHTSPVVSTFKPRAGGYAQPIIYDRFATVTGRLVVDSGPNILLLKKEHRSVIRPSSQNGAVMYLDFSSLEARVLLYESGQRCDRDDLYAFIAEKMGGAPRNVVKSAVLAELYGSSKNSLALTLGMSDDKLSEFIKKVGEIINTRSLLARLKKQFASEGYITNKFGRRIEVARPQDNIFINYYAQSTGVDVALIGFNNILTKLGSDGIRPLFVLHDALVLDVREDRISDVESMTSTKISGYDQDFYLKAEVIK